MEMSTYEIRLVRSEAERAAVFRLRYELYVEAQGLFGDTADHERRWLRDGADEHAAIWIAELDGEVVATARAYWGGEGGFDRQAREAFDIDTFTGIVNEADVAVASRLLIQPEHRETQLPILLFIQMMGHFVERGTELLLGECEPHLVNKWSRLGFRPYGLREHPTNGTLVRLALIVGDHQYADSIGSPLAPALKKWSKTGYAPRRLAARLAMSQRFVSELADRGRFWAAVEQALSLDQLALLLGGLSVEELEALLGNSHFLDCDPGAALIRKGHTSRTIYVLLGGTLQIRDEGAQIAEVNEPGAVLGEVAFFSGSERTRDVIVGAQGARVIALSERNLKKLFESQGPGAARLLLMLTRSSSNRLRHRTPHQGGPAAAGQRSQRTRCEARAASASGEQHLTGRQPWGQASAAGAPA
jgi:CRP-like cAMP-binding protein